MVRIITDSTTDLIPELQGKTLVAPLTVHFGEEEYIDGVTIGKTEFYEKLIESDVLPTTSQATPFDFEKLYEEVTAAGDSAVVITIASKLSGTCQSATIAAEDYENIYIVDSGTAAIGAGILVEQAYKYVEEGLDAKEIAEKLEEDKKSIIILAMVDTLEYLVRGGRLSRVAGFAGGLLNLKPVLAVYDGEIKALGKARGSKQAGNLLATQIEEHGVDFDKPILLGYTGLSDAVLVKYVNDSRHLWAHGTDDLKVSILGSVIGTHVGPGAIAVAFYMKH